MLCWYSPVPGSRDFAALAETHDDLWERDPVINNNTAWIYMAGTGAAVYRELKRHELEVRRVQGGRSFWRGF